MSAGLHLRLFATNPTTASLLPPCPEAPSRRIQMASELQVAAHRPSFRISLRMAACLGTVLGFVCLWVHVSQATSFCLSWDASRKRMTTTCSLIPTSASRFPSATHQPTQDTIKEKKSSTHLNSPIDFPKLPKHLIISELTNLPAPFAYHSSHHPSKPAAVDGVPPDGSPGAGRESWKSEIRHQSCLSAASAAPKERHNSRQ